MEIQKQLINEFGGITKLFDFIKQPFDELRWAGFRLLDCICKQYWGLSLIYENAGLFEYLTNRNNPDIMLGMEWKYTLLTSMEQNPNKKNVLSQSHQTELLQYLKQGVVYQQTHATTDVAWGQG